MSKKPNFPLVSVIVITKNSEKFISRCLKSIAQQTYKNIEVVLIDDNSSDETLKIAKSFRKKIRLKIIKTRKKNMGQARNIGIINSEGSFLAFCDSDDYYDRNKIKTELNGFKKFKEADVIYSNWNEIIEIGKKKKTIKKTVKNISNICDALLRAQVLNLSCILVKKKFKSQILFPDDNAGKYAEDWQYLLSHLAESSKMYFYGNHSSFVLRHKNSHTKFEMQPLMKFFALKKIIGIKKNILLNNHNYKIYKKSVRLNYLKLILAAIANKNIKLPQNKKLLQTKELEKLVKFYSFVIGNLGQLCFLRTLLKSIWFFKVRLLQR